MAAVVWAMTRVEERVVEVKEVVRSSCPHHGGWIAMAIERVEMAVRVEASVDWEAKRSSNNSNSESSSSNFQLLDQHQQQW